MSRHTISALDPDRYEIAVGWDSPMRTFFGQVRDRQIDARIEAGEIDEDKVEPIVFWPGGKFDEFPRLDDFVRAMAPYATIQPDMFAALAEDKAKERMR